MKRFLTVVGLLACIAALPSAASANHRCLNDCEFGVFRNSGQPDRVKEFVLWVPHPVARVVDFFTYGSWAEISDPWAPSQWVGKPYELSFSVPMLPNCCGATLAQGAAGAYNAHFQTLASNLQQAGFGDAIIRLGWEFNCEGCASFPWRTLTPQDREDFKAYWRHIVNTMRGTVPSDATFRFEWAFLNRGSSWSPAEAYPGNAYVDIIGNDVYDEAWPNPIPNHKDRWDHIVGGPMDYGLIWHANFAAINLKPVSFPEWGLSIRTSSENGGGDNNVFIARMDEWFEAHVVAYQAYFESDSACCYHAMMEGNRFPLGAAQYRSRFGEP